MPKTTHAGASYFGHEGVVEDANGKLSQLDSARNVDGTVVDGFESENRDIEDVPNESPVADPTGVTLASDPQRDVREEEPVEDEKPADEREDEKKPAKTTARSAPSSARK